MTKKTPAKGKGSVDINPCKGILAPLGKDVLVTKENRPDMADAIPPEGIVCRGNKMVKKGEKKQ